MINKQLIRDTISDLRNHAREVYDRACLVSNLQVRRKLLTEQAKLSRISSELEQLLQE